MELYLLAIGNALMIFKPKQKPQDTLWDYLLFAQHFEISVDDPSQECVERLMSLTQPKDGFWYPSSREVWTQKTSDNAFDFEIQLKRHGRQIYTSTHCMGIVFRDSWSDKTVVKYRVAPGKFALLWFWAVLLFGFFLVFSKFSFVSLAVYIGVGFVFVQSIRLERRWLQSLIYEALKPGEIQITK